MYTVKMNQFNFSCKQFACPKLFNFDNEHYSSGKNSNNKFSSKADMQLLAIYSSVNAINNCLFVGYY